MTETKIVKKDVQFRLVEIKKVRFYQNDYTEFGLTQTDILKGSLNLGVNFELKPKEETITIFLVADFCKNNHKLFGIATSHTFKVKNFEDSIKFNKKGVYNLPDDLMKLWLSIAISDTRGMLVILNADHEYSKIILPLIHLDTFMKNLKEKQKKAD